MTDANLRQHSSPTGNRTSDEAQIRELLENWARAVREDDRDGVLARHASDIVMFDVPAPIQFKGIEEYRKTWDEFFSWQGRGVFDLSELKIEAGEDVAFCHSIITCGSETEGQFPVRLTVGLRKIDGAWTITHEHHSVPAEQPSS
jgi:uncharacterized protein (TIGR02246 family)